MRAIFIIHLLKLLMTHEFWALQGRSLLVTANVTYSRNSNDRIQSCKNGAHVQQVRPGLAGIKDIYNKNTLQTLGKLSSFITTYYYMYVCSPQKKHRCTLHFHQLLRQECMLKSYPKFAVIEGTKRGSLLLYSSQEKKTDLDVLFFCFHTMEINKQPDPNIWYLFA